MGAIAAQGFRVVAPDLRGFGESDCPPEPSHYTLKKSCSDLVHIMDHFDEPYAILIGHDWCAVVAGIHACTRPASHPDTLARREQLGTGRRTRGGALVWRFALHFPHRLRAVASVCTPFVPRLPVYMSPHELAELDRTLGTLPPRCATRNTGNAGH